LKTAALPTGKKKKVGKKKRKCAIIAIRRTKKSVLHQTFGEVGGGPS